MAAAQAALAAKAAELGEAGREVEGVQGKLEEVTAAMRDAHDQLTELQVCGTGAGQSIKGLGV